MKNNKHPKSYSIEIILTDGTRRPMTTTWHRQAHLQLEIDQLTHVAWTKQQRSGLEKGGRVQGFNRRFNRTTTK